MIKIGILGAGHLGKIHIKCLKELSDVYTIIGFYDPNEKNSQEVEAEYGIKRYDNYFALIEDADVVDIVTPTLSHYNMAVESIKKLKHIFIEKPITNTLDEALELIKLTREAGVSVQVGHVERFNPAFIAFNDFDFKPMFIEAHRLSTFNPRGTDVSIVLDLMIHDIDIVLKIVKSRVKSVSASGVSFVSNTPDIANARIEFENGCVANLTASRISMKGMRKMRVFQKNAYVAIDFLEKKAELFKLLENDENAGPNDFEFELGEGKSAKRIAIIKPEIQQINAIKEELYSFAKSIKNNKKPEVSIEDGFEALNVAHMVLNQIKKHEINS